MPAAPLLDPKNDFVFYGIEMQVRRQSAWDMRSAFYLARTFANQLQAGQDYEDLCPAIATHLMDFELFNDPAQAHWRFELRDCDQPAVRLTSALQWNLIELPKLDRQRTKTGALAAWVAYFEHWREDAVMSAITHTPVQQARQELEQLSGDEEAQRLAFVRERAQRDERSIRRAERREGREEGKHEARLEFARKLFDQPGMDDATIAQLTDLTENEVQQLRQSAKA
ncbi:MAG: Rpn family recombination-promoting nuclease/putative transposase [Burkholderiales bacterium]|nr:Rpn family recombination-promoting nuclease/putative transposase [Burkholderiales bacterium]